MISRVSVKDIAPLADMIMRMSVDHCKIRIANREDIIDFFEGMADNPATVFLKYSAEEDGPVMGGICFMVVPFMWNGDHLRAVEVAFHADPILSATTRARVMISLLDAAEEELLKRDVDSITIGTQAHNDLGHYLEKRGYNFAEKLYMKAVPK